MQRSRAIPLLAADVFCSVQNLPLQIREIDAVAIDETNRADACGRKVKAEGDPSPPAPMHKTRADFNRRCPGLLLRA